MDALSLGMDDFSLGMNPGLRRIRERRDGCSVPTTEGLIKSCPFWDGASPRWGEFGMQAQPGCRELETSSHPAFEEEHPQDLLEKPHPLGVWL